MQNFGIGVAAKETGITESTLRRWEEAGHFTTERMDLGGTAIRVYSAETIDMLKRIRRLIDDGMRVGAAFEFLRGGL